MKKFWKTVVGLVALTCVLNFTVGAQEGRPFPDEGIHRGGYAPEPGDLVTRWGQGYPGWDPKVIDVARPLTIIAVESGLELTPEEREKFLKAYSGEMEKGMVRWKEVGEDHERWRIVEQENLRTMRGTLGTTLGTEKGRRAWMLVGPGGVEDSFVFFIERDVTEPKLKETIPLLVKFRVREAELLAKARGLTGAERDTILTELTELRRATMRDLAPFVGDALAKAWHERLDYRAYKFNESSIPQVKHAEDIGQKDPDYIVDPSEFGHPIYKDLD